MAFDFKKEYPALYHPGKKPSLIQVPSQRFVAVEGCGDPNQPEGAYQQALQLLYGIAFTIRMSYKSGWDIPGYFEYVVPPLESFWWMQDGSAYLGNQRKELFAWRAAICLPDFVTEEIFQQAKAMAAEKKGLDMGRAFFHRLEEGHCVQCLHNGSYDTESETLSNMEAYAEAQGWQLDLGPARLHHEIYLSDPRRTAPEKLKTILRLPIRERE